jgi:glycosyltransferase involved in cell wall biosynthesis
MKPLSIAFITADDPRDKRSWSGTNHFLLRTLEKHLGKIEILGPYSPKALKFFCSGFNFLTLRLLNKRFDYRHSKLMRNAFGRHFSAMLKKKSYDLVIISASTSIAAGIETELPVIYLNDRCIEGAMDYHKVLTQLFDFSRKQSIETDRLAIRKSRLSVFSSFWASEAARQNNPDANIRTIPFGANLEEIPDKTVRKKFPDFPIKLLFAGVNWEDKGGIVAFETMKELIARGFKTELIVCGCIPPVEHPSIKVEGFLDKNKAEDFAKLIRHFQTADFFILPTKYEAYGLVFCESAAYGLPALGPMTGGIPTIIIDGKTGFLFPVNATGKDYAARIIGLITLPEQYTSMSNAAYERFTSELNWDAWADSFRKLLEEEELIQK